MKAMKPAAPPICDRGGMRPTWSILCITTPPAPMHAPMPALRSSVLSAICAAAWPQVTLVR
eukprot:CAMPEP_0185457348 /NCGR_PEP_ID=MMETSP1365-20130426/79752_1 /TAXON_ID=38817 /ORGANISM="Gephyrocapsa oceanica, Strain RCC1303" /LENGTH=60 /DNA_ID=CAMNT_0028063805 /DNA_START=136 /DNA_END=314 /DNA_ORIENTATION=-